MTLHQAGACIAVSADEAVSDGRSQAVSSSSRPREMRATKKNIRTNTPPQNANTASTQRTSPKDMASPFLRLYGAFASVPRRYLPHVPLLYPTLHKSGQSARISSRLRMYYF